MPESCIEEVENCVLGTTDVKVNRHPVVFSFLWTESIVVFRIKVAQVIPAASPPLRHCVCFALRIFSALRALAVDPGIDGSKRRFTCTCRLIRLNIRELNRKFAFWNCNSSAARAVYQRDWFTPVALAAENPVAELVVYCSLTDFLFFKEFNHLCDGILFVEAV